MNVFIENSEYLKEQILPNGIIIHHIRVSIGEEWFVLEVYRDDDFELEMYDINKENENYCPSHIQDSDVQQKIIKELLKIPNIRLKLLK
ncbi:hypothetical protein [Falsibacillus pallidus]|uniref:hypothetical protein n=1 Tax=Falsibacillus pallidus TaxID=493781 RepID=UPI003D982A24